MNKDEIDAAIVNIKDHRTLRAVIRCPEEFKALMDHDIKNPNRPVDVGQLVKDYVRFVRAVESDINKQNGRNQGE